MSQSNISQLNNFEIFIDNMIRYSSIEAVQGCYLNAIMILDQTRANILGKLSDNRSKYENLAEWL